MADRVECWYCQFEGDAESIRRIVNPRALSGLRSEDEEPKKINCCNICYHLLAPEDEVVQAIAYVGNMILEQMARDRNG